jgi:hypothetical protein
MDSLSALGHFLEASIVRILKKDVITKLMSTVNNVINGAVEVIAYVVAFFLLNIIGTALKESYFERPRIFKSLNR